MPEVRFGEGTESLNAPLATIARTAIASLGSSGTVHIGDEATIAKARRKDDIAVMLERCDEQGVSREQNQVRLRYKDATGEAALAALIAAAAAPMTPVLADPASLAVLALAQRLGGSDIPVLIGGPTGTGKEVLSRFIHMASARASKPFIAINCAAMPEAMLEALLFGHRKGSFTGASEANEGFFRAADGGTLLLDELAEMPLALQAKLLRALQEGEVTPLGATRPIKVDVRIIACTNRDLALDVAEGRFRADLYYRLNVFPLMLPALRERPGDIAPLAFSLALRHLPAARSCWIDAAALAKLQAHPWPGNVRELENVIRRALLLAGDATVLTAQDIVFDTAVRPVPSLCAVDSSQFTEPPRSDGRLSSIVREAEMDIILEALRAAGGNRLATARNLGISERTLRYRLADMRDAGIALAGGIR